MPEPERLSLARLPTPLHRLERLSAALSADIWIKRDDLTGLELSGNKVRKLEYIIAEARAAGCDTLVTEGTPQSNHCRATAAACVRVGMHCTLLLRPPPVDAPNGNHLLDLLFGAQIRTFTREQLSANRDAIVAGVLAELRAAGRQPRFTPMGASEPLGCWGYIRAAAELAEQLHAVGVRACDLVVAISSGATYAGLVLGRAIHHLPHIDIWAVPVSDDVAYHRREVSRLCEAVAARFGVRPIPTDQDLRFIDGFVGAGYAVPYAAANDALRLLARTEAIVLDPVYTAKACCAMLAGVREGRLGRRRPVVFLHTGGVFSDFAWPTMLLAESEAGQ